MTELEQKLMEILLEHDSESLFELSGQIDEYKHEAIKISALVDDSQSIEQIESIIASVFHAQFDVMSFYPKGADPNSKPLLTQEFDPPAKREVAVKAIAAELHELLKPKISRQAPT